MSSIVTYPSGLDYALPGALEAAGHLRLPDIAHALSHINRFTGHTVRPYSVAEHSLLVASIARKLGLPKIGQLAALMHDAHEAYIGDVATPVKQLLGARWQELERAMQSRVQTAFGLHAAATGYRLDLRLADLLALHTERANLTAYDGNANLPWPVLDEPYLWASERAVSTHPLANEHIPAEGHRPAVYREQFLQAFRDLQP